MTGTGVFVSSGVVLSTKKANKTVGDWISVPSPNFVARVGATTFCIVPLNWPSPKTP